MAEPIQEPQLDLNKNIRVTMIPLDKFRLSNESHEGRYHPALFIRNLLVENDIEGVPVGETVDFLSLRSGDEREGKVFKELVEDEKKQFAGGFKFSPRHAAIEDSVMKTVMKPQREAFKTILKEGKNARFLIISAHGGGTPWKVGESSGDGLLVEKLLRDLPQFSDIDGDGKKFEDRYDAVLLHTCNFDKVDLAQEISDHLGVPIIYQKGLSSYSHSAQGLSETVIVRP